MPRSHRTRFFATVCWAVRQLAAAGCIQLAGGCSAKCCDGSLARPIGMPPFCEKCRARHNTQRTFYNFFIVTQLLASNVLGKWAEQPVCIKSYSSLDLVTSEHNQLERRNQAEPTKLNLKLDSKRFFPVTSPTSFTNSATGCSLSSGHCKTKITSLSALSLIGTQHCM